MTIPMNSRGSTEIRSIDFVTSNKPTGCTTPRMSINIACLLSLLEIQRDCDDLLSLYRKVEFVRGESLTRWDSNRWRSSIEGNWNKSGCLYARNTGLSIDRKSDGRRGDWERNTPKRVGQDDSDFVRADGHLEGLTKSRIPELVL